MIDLNDQMRICHEGLRMRNIQDEIVHNLRARKVSCFHVKTIFFRSFRSFCSMEFSFDKNNINKSFVLNDLQLEYFRARYSRFLDGPYGTLTKLVTCAKDKKPKNVGDFKSDLQYFSTLQIQSFKNGYDARTLPLLNYLVLFFSSPNKCGIAVLQERNHAFIIRFHYKKKMLYLTDIHEIDATDCLLAYSSYLKKKESFANFFDLCDYCFRNKRKCKCSKCL